MQINAAALKSPLFCPGVTAEHRAAETPAVVREAVEQQARDGPDGGGGSISLGSRRKEEHCVDMLGETRRRLEVSVENMPCDSLPVIRQLTILFYSDALSR